MGAKPKKNGSISYAKWGYIFIAPFFLIFAVFQLIPLGSTIYYSFFEYYRSGLKIIGPTFVGLKNYITLFATDLPKYFGNTLLLWIIGFIPQIAISLLLAAWFTDLRLKLKGQTFFKTVIYMPNLIMASAFAMLFFALFSDNGPVNAALVGMGILKEPFSFLNSVWGNRGLIGLMNFLMWFGNTTIMLMAAIMGVDPTLYEAAELEADAEAGVLRFSGSITDMVDADAELGNIVLNLSQSEDDFDYEIDSDLGNVEFDGVSMENIVICNKASGKMKLDSSMGNIEIYFEQD